MSSKPPNTGRDVASTSPQSGSIRSRRSWSRTLLSNALRLSIWFSIFSILFRCPNTPEEVDVHSPRICKPYFQTRDYLTPHVQPYYDVYAAPYVDRVRPYTDQLYESVYLPSYSFTVSSYDLYAAPRITQARTVSQREWDRVVKPQLEQARQRALLVYQTSLGPYVTTTTEALGPYYEQASTVANNQYATVVLPTYQKARPYATRVYDQGSRFTSETVIPYTTWAVNSAVYFFQRKVWPPVRIVYGENVQPQLLKIKERLANYRDSKKLEAAADSVDNTASKLSSSASSQASASSAMARSELTSEQTTQMAETSSSIQQHTSSTQSSSSSSSSTIAPENILDDLKVWKAKFTRAAAEGAEGLRDRITEIAEDQITMQAQGTGDALVTALEEAAKSAIVNLKQEITSLISDIPFDDEELAPDTLDSAKDRSVAAIRSAGKKVKDAAQKLRSWRGTYIEETEKLVASAGDSTLDVVDSIREAGLQEIGMRWAGMDGVTYKDWSEYHALRKSFDEWRSTLQDVVGDHEGPKRARMAAEEVESRGMAIAEDAAKELARLKEVATWKIEARDSSHDFSTRYTPPGAARAAQKVVDAASEAVSGSSQGTAESLTSKVAEAADSFVQQAESATDRVKSSASSFASPAVGSVASASSSASSKASSASSPLKKSDSSTASSASSDASSISSSASSSLSSIASSKADHAASSASSASSSVSSGASSASKSFPNSVPSLSSSASSRSSSASSDLSDQSSSKSASISSRASSLSSRAAASRASVASEAGVTPQVGVPADTDMGRSIIEADRAKNRASREANVLREERERAAAKSAGDGGMKASSTTVPGSDADTDTIGGAASVSKSIASAVNAAGESYASVTSSVDRVERMRQGVSGADGRGRESPVEKMRSAAEDL